MPRQPRRAAEHNLQAKVLRYLTENHAPDVFGFAIPNAGRRTYRAAAALKAEGMMRGVADTCIMLPRGRTGWLELKTPRGVQSDEQQGFQARCKRLAHTYRLARTFDEAVSVLADWGALR
jgi:hypothetical protein